MRHRISRPGTLATALALVGLTTVLLPGQSAKTSAKSAIPRTPDGHPDLQGTYDLAMMTPFERLPGDPPYLTKEQAESLQKKEMQRRAKDSGYSMQFSRTSATSNPSRVICPRFRRMC